MWLAPQLGQRCSDQHSPKQQLRLHRRNWPSVMVRQHRDAQCVATTQCVPYTKDNLHVKPTFLDMQTDEILSRYYTISIHPFASLYSKHHNTLALYFAVWICSLICLYHLLNRPKWTWKVRQKQSSRWCLQTGWYLASFTFSVNIAENIW